ncbi:MAG: diacylglycerol kinase, partial [Marinibacterium sp.]|nr:diacylglycerol kinase [Marinibacterium sp.]
MARAFRFFLSFGVLVAIVGWVLSAPQPLSRDTFEGLTGDATRGAIIFAAGGCRGCHVEKGDTSEGPPLLTGGYRIDSPFGTFISPNISPSKAGIAGWSVADLGNALMAGVSPEGAHYY